MKKGEDVVAGGRFRYVTGQRQCTPIVTAFQASILKHPIIGPTRKIEVPLAKQKNIWDFTLWDEKKVRHVAFEEGRLRKEIGDYVNLFWPTYSFWNCMLWDSKRFSEMSYELNRQQGFSIKIEFNILPLYMKIPFKLFAPKSLSKVNDVKKFWSRFRRFFPSEKWGIGIIEYLDEVSKTDEHYFRVYENFECAGFGNVGAHLTMRKKLSIGEIRYARD